MIEYEGHKLVMRYSEEGFRMLELGNQIMNLEDVQNISAKIFYTGIGFKHISVDQNGKDGAIKLDLSKPITSNKIKSYDIITDFGTTEHVENLYYCLMNVYNACEDGTIIIHKNPKTGSFPNHGFHFFTLEFWEKYADMVGYDIIELYEHPIYHNTADGWECIAVLKFNMDKCIFPSPEKFETLLQYVKQA